MRSSIGRIILKIVELLGCIACVIGKAITDQEARSVFLRNQKFSREWSLIHNITWSPSGNAFANITYGGFTLITTLMLISRCIDSKSRPTIIEKIFLTVGMLCFCAMGGVVFAAFDQVPDELQDNAIILGCLSFFVALLMLIDLADPMARHITDTTQTDSMLFQQPLSESTAATATPTSTVTMITTPKSSAVRSLNIEEIQNKIKDRRNSDLPKQILNIQINDDNDRHNYRSSSKQRKRDGIINSTSSIQNITQNGNYHHNSNDDEDPTTNIDIIETKSLPYVQQPIFEKILWPEKKRPTKIRDPTINTSTIEFIHQQHKATESPATLTQQSNVYFNEAYIKDYRKPTQPPQTHEYHQFYDDHGPPRQRYDKSPLMVIRDYSIRGSRVNVQNSKNHLQQQQYQNQCYNNQCNRRQHTKRKDSLNNNHRQHCDFSDENYDDDDDGDDVVGETITTIKTGFVANAAKLWDNKIRRNNELNTIV